MGPPLLGPSSVETDDASERGETYGVASMCWLVFPLHSPSW